jgi:rhamnulokinase
MFGPLVDPGSVLGTLRDEVAQTTGAPADIKVITPASHDTASAVAAVPVTAEHGWAYLSSGTWSLLGAELYSPINSVAAREDRFTNERGVEKTIRFLKNITGLWLVQEVRRELEHRGDARSFDVLVADARQAEHGRTLVDPNHAEFASPGNMQEKLCRIARETNQPQPETPGQLMRCCLESLALCYADTLGQLERVLCHSIDVLHLVGGGTRNNLLNEMIRSAVGKPVLAGPVEATAIGNVLVQAIGCGELSDLKEIREVVVRSMPPREVTPSVETRWQELHERYKEVVSRNR